MNAVNRYLVNTAQAKTGLSTGVLIGYAAQAADLSGIFHNVPFRELQVPG